VIKSKQNILLWLLYALLAFPSFYFVYKFGSPYFGTNDYFDYYKLYKDWDLKNVDAPFNMRLVSSFFVHVLYKLGLNYDTKIIFENNDYDKAVFFNAILFNFICVVSTCLILFRTSLLHFKNKLLAFSAGVLYLLGFGTLFYELMPITDAFSILVFAIIYHLYLLKDYRILIPLIVLIFQREYVFLALGLVCLCDWLKYKHKYYLAILVSCGLLFVVYYILRKTYFYTATYDHQASGAFFLDSLVKIKFPILPYIKQTLMTLNLFLIYLGVIVYKIIKKTEYDKHAAIILFLLFTQINLISFAAVFGNNTGRYFYILIPMVIFQLIKESRQFVNAS